MKRYCRKLMVINNKGKPKNYMNMNVESQKKPHLDTEVS